MKSDTSPESPKAVSSSQVLEEVQVASELSEVPSRVVVKLVQLPMYSTVPATIQEVDVAPPPPPSDPASMVAISSSPKKTCFTGLVPSVL